MEIITKDNVIQQLATDQVLELAPMYSFVQTRWWKVLKDITIELSNKEVVTIPSGFITDLSTSPLWLWGIFPPNGDFNLAAVIHDYIYVMKINGITQLEADEEMLYWSKLINGNRKWNNLYDYIRKRLGNYLRFYAVRIFGKPVWNDNIDIVKTKKSI